MPGQSVVNHGMTGNGPTSEVIGRDGMLPSRLGYHTAAIGKMHFGPQHYDADTSYSASLTMAGSSRW